MDPLTMAAIFGGVGLLKNQLVDKPQEKKDRLQRADEIQFSPWLQMPLHDVREANGFNALLQGGMTGYSLGQNTKSAETQNKINEKMLDLMGKTPSPQVQLQVAPQAAPVAAPVMSPMQGGMQSPYLGMGVPMRPGAMIPTWGW